MHPQPRKGHMNKNACLAAESKILGEDVQKKTDTLKRGQVDLERREETRKRSCSGFDVAVQQRRTQNGTHVAEDIQEVKVKADLLHELVDLDLGLAILAIRAAALQGVRIRNIRLGLRGIFISKADLEDILAEPHAILTNTPKDPNTIARSKKRAIYLALIKLIKYSATPSKTVQLCDIAGILVRIVADPSGGSSGNVEYKIVCKAAMTPGLAYRTYFTVFDIDLLGKVDECVRWGNDSDFFAKFADDGDWSVFFRTDRTE
jgi:hypothetical protein